MNLRQLKYFCEIVACGSAATAAERLHVAPTAISMQIAMLESDLGGELFDRSRRPMSLTALGRYFHPRAKELLAGAMGLEEETRSVAAGRSGVLTIGYTRSSIFTILPRAIRAFSASRRNVKIELITLLSEHQYEQLFNGRIQVGVSRYLGPVDEVEGITSTPLMDDPFVAALPSGHPLTRRRSVRAAELADLAFIAYPKDPQTHFAEHTRALLKEAGVDVGAPYEANDIHTALGMVASGLGFSLVGKSVGACNRTDVCFVRVSDIRAKASVVAVTSASETSKVVSAFVDTLVATTAAL
ncbi:LysR family transcriptional regulator [Burkholderia cenocepacia]|uniref:LysR family transcriptional regulator n=1 Tax=Burkholderia cenocepacia TaxID=95486 RepID=UPI000F58EAFC|nr:LysR family transcriptional regulator [Burkholderia cenocepacia]RQU32773.1 LysR family transcriptional regulator [Burkholderia cenocepacia]RQU56986.1 LysR family transcriptional regulator [Burkholderia cenocepacia]